MDSINMQLSMFDEESVRKAKVLLAAGGTLGIIGAQFVAQGLKNIFLLQTAGLASIADLCNRAEKGLGELSSEMLEYMDSL